MKKNGPWTIKSSEVKYKNPWIEVQEDTVIRPDGKDGIYGVVHNKDGVSILAINDDDTVYLTKEFKYAIGRVSLEVVSGAVDEGEDAVQAAKRELREEVGLEASEWIDLGQIDPFTAVIKSWSRLYLARRLNKVESELDGTETLKIIKVPFEEAIHLVMRSEITHGPSCALILKAQHFLKNEGV